MEKEEFMSMWRHMINLQMNLDRRIVMGNRLTYKNLLDNGWFEQALLDELGELNHELKKNWCWWKKTQAPVDREKVLEEFADCLHFILSWQLASAIMTRDRYQSSEVAWKAYESHCSCSPVDVAVHIKGEQFMKEEYRVPPVTELIGLMNHLNFTIDEVYRAYIQKNKRNHERQDEGY